MRYVVKIEDMLIYFESGRAAEALPLLSKHVGDFTARQAEVLYFFLALSDILRGKYGLTPEASVAEAQKLAIQLRRTPVFRIFQTLLSSSLS